MYPPPQKNLQKTKTTTQQTTTQNPPNYLTCKHTCTCIIILILCMPQIFILFLIINYSRIFLWIGRLFGGYPGCWGVFLIWMVGLGINPSDTTPVSLPCTVSTCFCSTWLALTPQRAYLPPSSLFSLPR